MKLNLIIIALFSTSSLLSESYYLTIQDVEKESLVVNSPYDRYGFDKDGNHKDGGTEDSEGFNKDGIKSDTNSSIDLSLSQKLNSAENFSVLQELEEGNFVSFAGSFSFNKETITLISQDGKTAFLKSIENSNPYPSGIETVKNGILDTNTHISSDFIHQEPIYEERTSYYWTTPVNQNNFSLWSALSGDGSKSLTQSAATKKIGYRLATHYSNSGNTKSEYRVAQDNHVSYYEYNNTYRFRYYMNSWVSHKRSKTENVLVGYDNTDYSEFSNASVGDTIEILKPITLQYSVDGNTWNNVPLERTNISEAKVTFNIEGIDTNSIDFRLLDNGHSYTISTLTNFKVDFKNKRVE